MHDTTGYQTGLTTGWTNNQLNEQWLFAQHGCQTGCQVWQPVWQLVGCLFTRYNRLSHRLYNRLDNRLFRVNGVLQHSTVYTRNHLSPNPSSPLCPPLPRFQNRVYDCHLHHSVTLIRFNTAFPNLKKPPATKKEKLFCRDFVKASMHVVILHPTLFLLTQSKSSCHSHTQFLQPHITSLLFNLLAVHLWSLSLAHLHFPHY